MGLRRTTVLALTGATVLTTMGWTGLVAEPAGAKTPVGSGTYSCTAHTSGTVTFSHPWSDTGSGRVKVTMSLTLFPAECEGGSPVPTAMTLSGTLSFPNGGGGCTNGVTVPVARLTLTYSDSPDVRDSKVVGPLLFTGGYYLSIWPGRVRGSYPSADAGLLMGGAPSGSCSTGISSVTELGADLSNM